MMGRALAYFVLTAGAAVTSFPFAWMLLTALKSPAEAASPTLRLFPERWLWENFALTFQAAPFGLYFFNSLFVACVVTISAVLTSLMAGYAFARLRFRGRDFVFGIVLLTMIVPFEVTLVPNFILILKLGWYNRYPALIVPWCASAFSIFLMRQAFLTLPGDYFDAAKVDGCGHLRFLARVGTPLVKPAVITVALFAFLGSYNSLLWPLVVTCSDRMRVVQVALTVFSGADGARFNLMMCAATIVVLPTVLLYFASQRHFLEGSLGAGLKG